MSQEDEISRSYALRILPRAERDIAAHVTQLTDLAGAEVARLWYEGIFGLVATLAQNPRRCGLISENTRFRQEVRQILYRRTSTGPVWRILFTISENTEDAPTVNVLHIRHGAQRPITRAQARAIEIEAEL